MCKDTKTNTAENLTQESLSTHRNPDFKTKLSAYQAIGHNFTEEPVTDINPLEFFQSELSQRLMIDPDTFCRFASNLGWCRHPNNGMYVKVKGRFLTQGNRGDIMRDVSDAIAGEDNEFSHALMKQIDKLTSPNSLELLPELDVPDLKDDKDNMYLPYLNGVLHISKAGRELITWEMLNGELKMDSRLRGNDGDGEATFEQDRNPTLQSAYIWTHKIIQRVYIEIPDDIWRVHPWYKFLCFLATKPWDIPRDDGIESRVEKFLTDHFDAIRATIGKMIHTYNNPSNPVAVIFTDACGFEENNSGGTGKSLIAKSIKHLRTGTIIQCRDKVRNDAFFFENVVGDIDLLVLDDLDTSKMAFSQLYGYLTDGLVVNRKGEHRVKYEFEDNPRFVITTNEAISGSDVSDQRRRWDMQLEPFFNLKFQPKEINGNENFFEKWTDSDWQCFDNIMAHCAVYYFQCDANSTGCPIYENNTVERSIRAEIGNDMVDWLDGYFADLLPTHKVGLKEFREQFNEATGRKEQRKFKHKLNKWGSLRGKTISFSTERSGSTVLEFISFDWIPF